MKRESLKGALRGKPNIVTANLLRSGDVVYLGRDGVWVRDVVDAVIADCEDSLAGLEAEGQRAVAAQEVIGVYAMEVDVVDEKARPFTVRETIRAAHGPTV